MPKNKLAANRELYYFVRATSSTTERFSAALPGRRATEQAEGANGEALA